MAAIVPPAPSEYVQINKSYLESLHTFFDQVVNKQEKPRVSGLTAIKKLAEGAAGIRKPTATPIIVKEPLDFITGMIAANDYAMFEGNYLTRKNNFLRNESLSSEIKKKVGTIYDVISMILASVYSDDNNSRINYLNAAKIHIDSLAHIDSYKEVLKAKCETFKTIKLIRFDPNKIFSEKFAGTSDHKIGKYLEGAIGITTINTFVNDYVTKLSTTINTKDTTTEDSTKVTFTINIEGTDKTFRNMFASGNNSDCGIHSILTAFSENFRKLDSKEEKNTFATFFRKTVGYLASVKQYSERETRNIDKLSYKKELLERKYRFFTESVYLDTFDLADITNFFKINYLQHERKTTTEDFINNINTIETKEYILISNLSGNHFTPIKNTTDNTYIFDETIKTALLNKFGLKDRGKIICQFHNNDILRDTTAGVDNKEKYKIVSYGDADKEENCSSIKIRNLSDNGTNILDKTTLDSATSKLEIKKENFDVELGKYELIFRGNEAERITFLTRKTIENLDSVTAIPIPTVGGSRKIRKTRSFRKATRKTRKAIKHRKH